APGEHGLIDAQMLGERSGCRAGLADERLVTELQHAALRAPSGRDVASPRPGGAGRVACGLELRTTLGRDPEARARAVGEPRVAAATATRREPALLEQRADDVAPVADQV